MGRLPGLPRAGIGGEQRLEAGDLTAELVSAEPLVALDSRQLGRGPIEVELVRIHPRRGIEVGQPGGAPRVDGAGEVSRVDAAGPCALGRVGGQPFELRGFLSAVGDECSEALAGDDQPVVLEAPVNGASGVDVDAGATRELADAGEAVARPELPARDQDPQSPGELRADRKVVRARQAGGQLRLLRGLP